MTHDDAALDLFLFGSAFCLLHERKRKTIDHPSDGESGSFGIIFRTEEMFCKFGRKRFQIGQPYGHEVFEQFERFDRFVCRRIPAKRNRHALFARAFQIRSDERDRVASGDEVYVFSARVFERPADFNKFRFIDGAPHAVLRNLIILAKSAAKRTARKKNRTASAEHGNRRLFAEVQTRGCDAEGISFSAQSARGFSVGGAFSGTLHARSIRAYARL